MEQAKTKENQNKVPIMTYLLFLMLAYLATGAMLLLLAFALWRFGMSDGAVTTMIALIYLASAAFSGFLGGRKAKGKKLLVGTAMGVGYFLILAVLSVLTRLGNGNMGFFLPFFLCTAGGSIGGAVAGLTGK